MDRGRSETKLTSAARLPLLARDEAPILARAWYREDGSASPLTRSLATAPDLLETLMPFLGQIMGPGALDLPTKELVILRVSQLNGCRYCLAAHRPAALDAGVRPEQIDAVCERAPLDALAPRERAILAWVDQLTIDACAVTDELLDSTRAHVREDELVELTVLAGAITMLNGYCTAFALPPPS